ncbi:MULTISPECIES: DUF5665 domain-containing protein [Paenibacillus]|uniref:Uncharacterized protein n=1 Tax=Paenibacillus azoreducens TaxID=116718 RepID=A0A919YFR0_9BACL|nr:MULTISPECIES: DUF5665 domain-containing protein [Paenibacillus]MBE9915211.1 hypothetical protein [Paenibacillus donghaensis]GIO48335.1 hypothetical protein J34TS1_31000 [Paenibacillus azoreducens]
MNKAPNDPGEHPFELRHEVKRLNGRLDQIAAALEKAEIKDIIQNYSSPKRRLWTNFTSGIARGLGLSLGTFIILGCLGYILSLFVKMPVIGEYIADLLHYIEEFKR